MLRFDTVRIIGERINPTGKKLFKEALKKHDLDYIMRQALEQTGAGAEILDVNVGLPDIDEKEMMLAAVNAIQSVTDAPLQIDTTELPVLEAALRIVSGKPIVNSVNGEDEKLNTVLPLVKKYGAAVVGLTLDENGIPKTAEERFAIAEKILRRAQEYGIPKRDVYIDCLTLTASAEQDGVKETLKALRMVTEKLGLKTVLGVSRYIVWSAEPRACELDVYFARNAVRTYPPDNEPEHSFNDRRGKSLPSAERLRPPRRGVHRELRRGGKEARSGGPHFRNGHLRRGCRRPQG